MPLKASDWVVLIWHCGTSKGSGPIPVYQLLGGKCRFSVDCYAHATGDTTDKVAEDVAYNSKAFED